jgi:DNA-binding NtrC family response regulator
VYDDEPALASAGDVFANNEFYVVEATNAEEAIEILNVDGDNIEVLFSDIHMPGDINGIDLARQVQQKWPWIRIILVSRHPKPDDIPDDVHFVEKPFDFDSLLPLLYRSEDRVENSTLV